MDIMRAGRLLIGATFIVGAGWLINRGINSHLITWIVGVPRIDVPFAAGQKGAVGEASFHVPCDLDFAFTLDLYPKPGDEKDRSRIQKMAGSGARYPDGRTVDDGISIPVRLTIARSASGGEILFLRKEISDEPLEGYGRAYFKTMWQMVLRKGDYKIKIEALDNVPELEDVPINFDVWVPGRN